MAITPAMQTQLTAFIAFAQGLVDRNHLANLASYPELLADADYVARTREVVSVMPGGVRYARIVIAGQVSRSVYCFIDLENGDILKAEGWKKPAKHARGNLGTPSGWNTAVTAYGGAYLR